MSTAKPGEPDVVSPRNAREVATRDATQNATGAASRATRRSIGAAFVVLIIVLQSLIELLAGHERSRALFRPAIYAVQLSLLMLVLSALFEWAKRKRLGSIATLAGGAILSGVVGIGFGLMAWKIGTVFPELRFKPNVGQSPALRSALFGFLAGQFHFGIWALAFVYPFAVEDARIRALEAEQLASAADLARLRAHLEPHFLLNTLNAIAGLVVSEPREARKLLAALGDLLRDATRDGDEMQPLDDEIGWLRRYASILEARYAGSIAFEWHVDPRAGSVLVPRLLLQPLVENAVKHGALARGEGGLVAISIALDEQARVVRCAIEDNGPGMKDAPPRSGAFGLDAVRRRLSLKDERASLAIETSEKGTHAIVAWPMEVPS